MPIKLIFQGLGNIFYTLINFDFT